MIQVIYDLPSDVPGKTWKEKNMELQHKIPIGALVEIQYEYAPNIGVRLFVCKHTRDCDGTPLYALTWNLEDYYRFKDTRFENAYIASGGYSDNSLIVIKE